MATTALLLLACAALAGSACSTPGPAAPRIHCGTTYTRQLYESTCIACHSTDGTPRIGPTFLGLWGAQRLVVEPATGDVKTVTVDRAYLKESLHDPDRWKAVGFETLTMTPFTNFGEDELDAMAAFLASLR